jgi:hypothetical protein
MTAEPSARRWLILLAAALLAFRLWFSATLPITGDEAYFIYWGVLPDLGFYDHPPMIGWFLHALLLLSAESWVMRLPSTLLPFVLAAGIFIVLRKRGEAGAAITTAAFLLLPANVWNVLVTTDTPLVLFSFFCALCYRVALERRSPRWYALAGVLLGAAFLSKYFAVLLALALIVQALATPKAERDWRGLAITVACALPFGLLNLYWNYWHCWANVMFNLYNRHDDAGWSWKNPPLFVISVLYVLSPVALWQLARERAALRQRLAERDFRFFAVLFALPFALFAVLSSVKTIGLHWLLSFVPFFFLCAGLALTEAQLRRSVIYLAAFSGLHLVAIAVAAALPLETWKGTRFYDGIVYQVRIDKILARLKPNEKQYHFAADGYSPAVVASYYSGLRAARARESDAITALREHYFFVFGTASSHARHDDILTDFRALDGKNILVLRKNPPREEEYRPYFQSVEFRSFEEAGARFHVVIGQGFDYAAYRDGVLAHIRDRYYAIPRYLPQGRCYFCERYFGAETCPVR